MTKLSEKTIEIVKSTAPVLEAHGVTITSTFYKNMFKNHPELLNIFNQANQTQGKQQTALANMVYQAAKNIDQLEVLVPEVMKVAHKHRGLGVTADQYPIVGKYLLLAIKEVLQENATEEILNAWEEAYGVIAGVFIDVEKQLYESAKEQAGGWDDFKDFEVIKKVKESDVITSFYLKPTDGKEVPTYEAGQYITVRVKAPGDEYTSIRHYSLSSAPGKDYFRISVKKEADVTPNGKVSTYLHDHVNIGDTIEISAPAGDFVLEKNEEGPVAFISGGVGITPMISMLESLVDEGSKRPISFIHSARNEKVHAFKSDVQEMVESVENGKFYYGYSDDNQPDSGQHFNGYISASFLVDKISKDTVCYIVGPEAFMRIVGRYLVRLGVPKENIRYELFGPAVDLLAEEVAAV